MNNINDDENKTTNNDNTNHDNDIEVVLGDSSELNFSEVEDFVEALKPKVTKKTNIIIPVAKKKNEKKDENKND